MHKTFKMLKAQNKKGLLLIMMTLAIMTFVGCQNDTMQVEDLGSYFFGDLDWDNIPQLNYEGEYLRIPYLIEGFSEMIQAEFGWFFFVDGLPQRTRFETLDGEIFREEAYMHEFSLSYRERDELYVVFRPTSGQIGETIMAVDNGMFRPSHLPDINYPYFGNFHSLVSTLPREISINHEIQKTLVGHSTISLQPISQDIIDAEMEWFVEEADLEASLRGFRRLSIIPDGAEFQLYYEGIIEAADGQVNFTFLTYGGEESRRRITFFVNHEPVQVAGFDYIEIDMEHGQMLMLDISLTLENLDQYNTIYALMATSGEASNHDVFKTPTLLLINE